MCEGVKVCVGVGGGGGGKEQPQVSFLGCHPPCPSLPWELLALYIIHLFICLFGVGGGLEDSLGESVLSFYYVRHMRFQVQTQAIRLGSNGLPTEPFSWAPPCLLRYSVTLP